MRVVLVGNSTELKGKGRYIDSFDCVVRMNGGAPNRLNRHDIGTYTHVWSFSSMSEAIYQSWKALFPPSSLEWRLNGRLDYDFCGGFNGNLDQYRVLVDEIGGGRPSTGLITADYMRRALDIRPVLIGFDFFTHGTWYRSGTNHGPHDGDREREHIRQLGLEVI